MRAILGVLVVISAAPALAQSVATPAVHPLYAEMPGSTMNPEAKRLFSAAAGRYGLGPVEVMDIAAPPAPRAPELLKVAAAANEKLKFAEAEAALDAAVAEVMTSGGAGMSAASLSELFLQQAIAAQKANWLELESPVTELAPAKAREAYLRAAVLAPERVLERRRYRPLAIASYQVATAEVKQRPRGQLKVWGPPGAEINLDAGPDRPAPASATQLPYGEHFVRVEAVGHPPFGVVVTLTAPDVEVAAQLSAALVPDDREAAAHARRMGASFALLSFLKMGPRLELELHLIDAVTGQVRNSTVVPYGLDTGPLEAAVMRLDEEARRTTLVKHAEAVAIPGSDLTVATVPDRATPGGAPLRDDPRGWAQRHWPLLTAIGVAVGTAIVLGIAVANDSRGPR
jgi:hypothetical protein